MKLSYYPVPISVNFSLNFLKVIRDQKWPTPPLFFVNISHPFRDFMAPLRHILLIQSATINSSNFFANLRWTFTF
jgi:hypothetical protein